MYKFNGPADVPAKYVMTQAPTLVLVENYRNPAAVREDAERLGRHIEADLKNNKVVPTVDPAALEDLRSRKDYKSLSTSAIGRALGARQIVYADLTAFSVESALGTRSLKGKAELAVKVIDANSGQTLWPENTSTGYPLSLETPWISGSEMEIREQMCRELSDKIGKQFRKWKPDYDSGESGDDSVTSRSAERLVQLDRRRERRLTFRRYTVSPKMVAVVEKPRSESVAYRVLLSNISWETYTCLLDESEGRGLRMTYDAGSLQIEMPSLKHERIKMLIGQLIEQSMLHAHADFVSAGSTTWRREVVQRGAEPDQCYYIANFEQMKGVEEVELSIHPPPDLVIEVDLSNSSLDQQPIYAALDVPELWRVRGDLSVEFLVLGDHGFAVSKTSKALPFVDPLLLTKFLVLGGTAGHSQSIQGYFRAIAQ